MVAKGQALRGKNASQALIKSSWYEDDLIDRPDFPEFNGEEDCEVAIIGGGFTGLSAAYHLAKAGVKVILLEAKKLGDGASGRNGGQLGTGHRQWVGDLEKIYGFTRTKALFDLAEKAKDHLLSLSASENFSIDYQEGHLSVAHRPKFLQYYAHHIEDMLRYGYTHLELLSKDVIAEKLGSKFYYGGIRDSATGHIHPLKAVVGLALSAQKHGAKIFEKSLVFSIKKVNKTYYLYSNKGSVKTKRILLATNAYNLNLQIKAQKYVAAIHSYIGATEPLPPESDILPMKESVDDSRFVVRYFRKTKENVLLFGGAENYTSIGRFDSTKEICKQLIEVYPQLKDVSLTHSWGGRVGITRQRMPYVRHITKEVTYCGGYSGHGVMLAPYVGKLYADALLGHGQEFNLLQELKISPFPGGLILRRPVLFLAMHWFSLLDRL